jgi:hypothetical protein
LGHEAFTDVTGRAGRRRASARSLQSEWEFTVANCSGYDADQRRSTVGGVGGAARADQLRRDAQERIRSLPELGRLVFRGGLCVEGER